MNWKNIPFVLLVIIVAFLVLATIVLAGIALAIQQVMFHGGLIR